MPATGLSEASTYTGQYNMIQTNTHTNSEGGFELAITVLPEPDRSSKNENTNIFRNHCMYYGTV
jgi:hypothetical protein